MMLYVLLALIVIVAPIVLSIAAFVRVGTLLQELRELRTRVDMLSYKGRKQENDGTSPVSDSLHEKSLETSVPPLRQSVQKTPPITKPIVGKEVKAKAVRNDVPFVKPVAGASVNGTPKAGMEFMMGGKAAAFAGIGILVAGIALLVGYAIQHAWIGPAMRTGFGLLAAVALVGLGHYFSRKGDGKYCLFAQVLTGGGSGLFYFTVYAAYGFYELIGGTVAGAGLFVSAIIVFVLAMIYRSQAIAVLGVVGAFVTPLLIGSKHGAVLFLLIYAAVVNVPVILLGVRRKWQILYNLAFLFTVAYFILWVIDSSQNWVTGLVFALVFYAEYAALGLLKLRNEQRVAGRTVDAVRLILASLLLIAAVYGLMDDNGQGRWTGSALMALALAHLGLAFAAHRILTRFRQDILAFVAGGACCVAFAVPAQFDGEWVSIGWALEGVVLAWYACRVGSHIALLGGCLLGVSAVLKSLLFDGPVYVNTPRLFWNARFATGVISSVLLGIQGKLAGRFSSDERYDPWQDLIWWAASFCLMAFFFVDTFRVLGEYDPYCWFTLSLVLLVVGAGLTLLAPRSSTVTILGSILLLVLPLKILVTDGWFMFLSGDWDGIPFSALTVWLQLVVLCGVMGLVGPRARRRGVALVVSAPEKYSTTLNVFSLLSILGIVTMEILRDTSDWANTAVTIFWAMSALALIIYGMKKRVCAHRYLGLALFALTTAKVLLVDSSELKGLHRIAAFIGTGVLLLLLSFAYQKAAAFFVKSNK